MPNRISWKAFARDEHGSQVIEYGLIIALVSIVLVLTLNSTVTGLTGTFADLAARVKDCFSSTSGSC